MKDVSCVWRREEVRGGGYEFLKKSNKMVVEVKFFQGPVEVVLCWWS